MSNKTPGNWVSYVFMNELICLLLLAAVTLMNSERAVKLATWSEKKLKSRKVMHSFYWFCDEVFLTFAFFTVNTLHSLNSVGWCINM